MYLSLDCRQQGQKSSVNIYPCKFPAFRIDESPAAQWDKAAFLSGACREGWERED
jgi:hypothetical protein